MIYVVKQKMPDHSWYSTAGTYEATNEALGNRIARLLEEDGAEVTKQDTKQEVDGT